MFFDIPKLDKDSAEILKLATWILTVAMVSACPDRERAEKAVEYADYATEELAGRLPGVH